MPTTYWSNDTFCLRRELEDGKDPNYQDEKTLTTHLHAVCANGETDCVVLLLEFKADPNITDKEGMTPLHEACIKNKPECVRYLLEANADPVRADKEGNTPLHYACQKGASECTRLLLAHKDVALNAVNSHGLTALHMACLNKEGGLCPFLLLEKGADTTIKDDMEYTPLAIAAATGCPTFVRILLEHDADPNTLDKLGRTPLYIACHFRNADCVRILANHEGVDIHKAALDGKTPLHEAIYDRYSASAWWLLEKGADMHKADESGETPWTLGQHREYFVITQMLEEYMKRVVGGRKRERSEDESEDESEDGSEEEEDDEPSAKRGRSE